MTRGTGQHNDLGAGERTTLSGAARPTVGPIAAMPDVTPLFVAAVEAGGATVTALSPETRGLVWLSETAATELADVLAANPGIQWVQLPWAGVDAFAEILEAFADKPFPVWTSAKGAYSEPVAEQALGLTIALLRDYPQKAHATRWGVPKTGTSLYGLNVVVIGAGGISRELLRLLSLFDADVTVVRRSVEPMAGATHTVVAAQLHDVLPAADVVIIAAASTTGTAKLIGAPELSLMKSTAVLVNVARGALVDTDALVAALASGAIAGAGLDVTAPEPLPEGHPLWSEPRCLITSHSADTPEMTRPLLASRITLNVKAFLGDGRFAGVVDPAAGY